MMEDNYMSLKGEGCARYEEKKSVFIGYARPLSTENEALAFLAAIKQKHPDARHHVYAYRLRERQLMRYSDDREPQGTAGLPVLDVLRKSQCVDAAIVVVRYFGGTLLGTGGLVRAYTAAAQGAFSNAGTLHFQQMTDCTVSVGYGDYQKVLPLLSNEGAVIEDTHFGENVEVLFSVDKERATSFATLLSDATGGRASFCVRGNRFVGK